jgi:MFS family permease
MVLVVAGGLFMVMTHGLMAWAPYFAVTRYHESIAIVGLKFGTFSAVAGLMGTALGGLLGDRLRRSSPRGRLYVSLLAMTLPAPLAWFTLTRQSLDSFLFAFVFLSVATTAWLPGMLSTIQDLVLPRMRGLVYAVFVLGMTIIGLGCGPYVAGLVSDATGNLGTGVLSLYLLTPVIAVLMLYAIFQLDRAETTRLDRAREAGEVLEPEPGMPGGL